MAHLRDTRQDQLAEANRLYEQYARHLEKDHAGELVAISPQGEVLLGTVLYDLIEAAERQFGPGNFIFKVGERVVATWRCLKSV